MFLSDLQLHGGKPDSRPQWLHSTLLHSLGTGRGCFPWAAPGHCLSLAEIQRQAGCWQSRHSSDQQPWLQDSSLDLGKLQEQASQMARGKESICQCRRHGRWGFDSWVRKIPWRRKWQPTPVLLPGKSRGQSVAGPSPWGHKESDTTEHAHTCLRTEL